MTFEARHIAVSIERSPRDVVAFVADPANLPRWAAGLAAGVERVGDAWVARSPMGPVTVRFAAPNAFGVLDHDVGLPTGEVVTNPMRVVANDGGSELVFTLLRRPGVSAEEFARDAATVAGDLARLKTLLESGRARRSLI